MKPEEMGIEVNNKMTPQSNADLPSEYNTVTILDINKLDTLRLDMKNANLHSDKEKEAKDLEAGPKICELCDFETAITATGEKIEMSFQSRSFLQEKANYFTNFQRF